MTANYQNHRSRSKRRISAHLEIEQHHQEIAILPESDGLRDELVVLIVGGGERNVYVSFPIKPHITENCVLKVMR
jgi:hypothetical protein